MRRRIAASGLAAGAAAVIGGCGEPIRAATPIGSPVPATSAAVTPAPAAALQVGRRTFRVVDASGRLTVIVPARAALVRRVERIRRAAGVRRPTYVLVRLSAHGGRSSAFSEALFARTSDGHESELRPIYEALGDWQRRLGIDDPAYERGMQLYQRYLAATITLTGPHTDTLYVADPRAGAIVSVFRPLNDPPINLG